MARDFRPKSARSGATKVLGLKKGSAAETKKAKRAATDIHSESSSDGDEESLLKEIKALGGDESDLTLISSKNKKDKEKTQGTESEDEPNLSKDVLSFMKGLDFAAAGVELPRLEDANVAKGVIMKDSKTGKKKSNVEASTSSQTTPKDDSRKKKSQKGEVNAEADTKKSNVEKDQGRLTSQSVNAYAKREKAIAESEDTHDVPLSSVARSRQTQNARFILPPTARWSETQLEPLQLPSIAHPSADEIAALQQRGQSILHAEKTLYAELTKSGKNLGPGMLSSSDARLITELLAPGARSGTLSDRIAALTLLAQSSPVHNIDAMDSLLTMASKKGREESGRATRALADWLASGGGLSERKLRYLRDHPATSQLVNLVRPSFKMDTNQREKTEAHLLLAVFEDKLKRFYFQFLQLLETQSHDTLPFVRKQAVTQIFLLLKEKPEQEQNLLRLLVNKLGDTDRAVASQASTSLLNTLNVHPNMKAVVTTEISHLILKPTSSSDADGRPRFNPHAQYYGILTLNQTMLTSNDASVANRLVSLYFELFENVIKEMSEKSGGREEDASGEEQAENEKPKKQKRRWRDGKGKKGSKAESRPVDSKTIQDADAKTIAAILTGVRRALPFAKVDGAVFDKHMSTLFRITHSSTFNIAIQALQLIFQVSLSHTGSASSSNQAIGTAKVEDRFYRALYGSLLDPRLATTSKQAMYLNLLFKAVKADHDTRRVKAFVKRFVQTFSHAEPPWICGGLFLFAELTAAQPSLRTLLEEAEDEDEEHFVDAAESSDGEEKSTTVKARASKNGTTERYDALKREPEFAKAERSCLWELIPLLSHFHPSVSLHAQQLLRGEGVTTTADLTLNTLAHFLDRFVYRNPKKKVAQSKGASIMQPATNVQDGKAGLEHGVVKLKGVGIRQDEYVNDEKFWRKKVQEVPVDQLFFHKYFTQRLHRDGRGESGMPETKEGKSADSDGEEEARSTDEKDSEEDSEEEREIWKAMKRSMPRIDGDEMLDESDVDEDDDEALPEYDDSEDEAGSDESEKGELDFFDEDDDDLMSVDLEVDEETIGEMVNRGKKRAAQAEANDNDSEEDKTKEKSKSQLRREERKRRKAMPTFASAEDYAHLQGGDSDEVEV